MSNTAKSTPPSPDWIDFPLVSGLMVFSKPQQIVATKASIDCFFSQSWPHKELIVFNSTPFKLTRWWKKLNPVEIRLKPTTLGKALDLCRSNSNGEWCINWMPDCWYDKEYIASLMKPRDKRQITLLKNKEVFSLKNQKRTVFTGESFECWNFYRHFQANFETTDPLPKQFPVTVRIDNPLGLVVKFVSQIV